MNEKESLSFESIVFIVGQQIMDNYWHPLHKYLQNNKEYIENFTTFLLEPKEQIFYFGKTHLAIEYKGSERNGTLNDNKDTLLTYHDLTESENDFIEEIVGFEFNGTTDFKFPLPEFTEDLIAPNNNAVDKLIELGWNFEAQNSMMAINSGGYQVLENQFCRLVNSLFFDSNENGLITRHIKWIDFIPLKYENSNSEYDSIRINTSFYSKLIEHDAKYIYPLPDNDDFKYKRLPQLNRFIEISGNATSSETDITSFLEVKENRFILSMAFLAKKVYPQVKCDWQSENRNSLIPDFFVLRHNGFADIVEFKLPSLKSASVVGTNNREVFSAEINKHIAQTRTHEEYFNDPNNRSWFADKYGFEVYHPKRILVMGRRGDFSSKEWRAIENDFKNIKIMTYDELIDGVMAQFYM